MNALVSFRIALRALGANKLRAGLTMLGMVIGVGAVIAMVSVGKGAQPGRRRLAERERSAPLWPSQGRQ